MPLPNSPGAAFPCHPLAALGKRGFTPKIFYSEVLRLFWPEILLTRVLSLRNTLAKCKVRFEVLLEGYYVFKKNKVRVGALIYERNKPKLRKG